MTGIADGCARAASGHANVLPMNVMNSRRCMYLNTILRLCKRSTLRRAARENLYPFGSQKRPGPMSPSGHFQTHASQQIASYSITLSKRAHHAHSGNPALRRPSICSFAFDSPPRAIYADIVKAGSISSTRAAASRASASRPRWAKADARQR